MKKKTKSYADLMYISEKDIKKKYIIILLRNLILEITVGNVYCTIIYLKAYSRV